jgi:hypothetical protein
MDNFNLRKYLTEGRLLKENNQTINLTPQQKKEFKSAIRDLSKMEDFEYAVGEAGNVLANILTNGKAEYIEYVEDFGYDAEEVENYAQDLVGNNLTEGKLLNEETSKVLNENEDTDIVSFLKSNKQELLSKLTKKLEYLEDEDDEESTYNYKIVRGANADGKKDVEIAGLLHPEYGPVGLDFSFNPEKVKDEYGDAGNFKLTIAGKPVYGISYNM